MTPANPDALADALARELARLDGWQDPDALWTDNLGIIARGGEGSPVYLDYVEDAGKLIAGPLAPLLADLQRVTAERDLSHRTNDLLRAGLANSGGPCLYCTLPREEWTKCEHGFPGCDRADDAMLCPHFGAEMEGNDRADAAEARAAQLQAEVEVKDKALREVTEQMAQPDADDFTYAVCQALIRAKTIARTALAARAATAREG